MAAGKKVVRGLVLAFGVKQGCNGGGGMGSAAERMGQAMRAQRIARQRGIADPQHRAPRGDCWCGVQRGGARARQIHLRSAVRHKPPQEGLAGRGIQPRQARRWQVQRAVNPAVG